MIGKGRAYRASVSHPVSPEPWVLVPLSAGRVTPIPLPCQPHSVFQGGAMGSTVGQFCIAVNDLEESVRFYTEIMGLVEHGRTEIPNVNEVHLAGAEGEHGGRLQLAKFNPTMTPQPIDHGRALWKIYIYVDDAVATWEKAVAAGYESHMKPERLERWPVIVGFISDPDGYLIEIIESEGPRPGH
ncbi:MAG: hypothetical protein F2607_01130 [Actinobacteria bacterium]|nr:hypothetical protein [Actinomycetota bacterium]